MTTKLESPRVQNTRVVVEMGNDAAALFVELSPEEARAYAGTLLLVADRAERDAREAAEIKAATEAIRAKYRSMP